MLKVVILIFDLIMAVEFIGRKLEKRILKEAIDSSEAEMVAVIGRRRIGKTFLITSAYEKQIVFEISGLQSVSLNGQLKNFAAQLTKVINPDFPIKTPSDWFEAFQLLINYLNPLMGKKSICLKHLLQIKKALGIASVYTIPYSFTKKGTASEKDAQIDLVLDRADSVITLIEMKFHNEVYSLSKSYAEQLNHKRSVFKKSTKTRKQLSWAMVTAFGFKPNQHSLGLIDNHLTMDVLFEDIVLDY